MYQKKSLVLSICIAIAVLLSFTLLDISLVYAGGKVSVKGYYRKDGTYVKPHYRTSPDGNPYNNYSFPGNYNPNTGKITTGNPDTYLKNYNKTGEPAPVFQYKPIDNANPVLQQDDIDNSKISIPALKDKAIDNSNIASDNKNIYKYVDKNGMTHFTNFPFKLDANKKRQLYKVVYDDGTVLYTNTPSTSDAASINKNNDIEKLFGTGSTFIHKKQSEKGLDELF